MDSQHPSTSTGYGYITNRSNLSLFEARISAVMDRKWSCDIEGAGLWPIVQPAVGVINMYCLHFGVFSCQSQYVLLVQQEATGAMIWRFGFYQVYYPYSNMNTVLGPLWNIRFNHYKQLVPFAIRVDEFRQVDGLLVWATCPLLYIKSCQFQGPNFYFLNSHCSLKIIHHSSQTKGEDFDPGTAGCVFNTEDVFQAGADFGKNNTSQATHSPQSQL